jgi:hypothetical protein
VARRLGYEPAVDAVVENLANTLKELGAFSEAIGEVAVIASGVKDDVLSR